MNFEPLKHRSYLQFFNQFFTDIIKNQVLIVVLGGPVLAGFLKIVQSFGTNFFYYLWVFVLFVQAFMITVYPLVILPMFNKLTPLEPGPLKTEVEALATRLQFPLKHLYVIDGSKRSAHSNAYFYGLPWSKHIVIYDTLIEKSEVSEVVAVLCHELGHWSEGHTTKLFAIAQVRSPSAFWTSTYCTDAHRTKLFITLVSYVLHICPLLCFHQQRLPL